MPYRIETLDGTIDVDDLSELSVLDWDGSRPMYPDEIEELHQRLVAEGRYDPPYDQFAAFFAMHSGVSPMVEDPFSTTQPSATQPIGVTPQVRAEVRHMIEVYEGNSPTVYPDPKGIPTIGIGHNLISGAETFQKVTGLSARDAIDNKVSLTDAQVNQLFDADLDAAIRGLKTQFPKFDTLPPEVQITLIDLSFNLGHSGLGNFRDFIQDINNNDFRQAAFDLGHKNRQPDSPPSKYVGDVHQRAQDNIDRLNRAGAASHSN